MSHHSAPNAPLPDLAAAHATLKRLIEEDVYAPVHRAYKRLILL